MSKYLATLLSKETSGFKKFIDDIEHATGYNKHDLKLSSSIKLSTNHKIRSLGLNPKDTTSEELYFALNNLVKLHDKFIVAKIDSKYGAPTSAVMDQIAATFNKPTNHQNVFCIKPSVAKKLLTKNQPKQTTNLLGYRSLDSMIKNEDPKTLLSLAFYVESEDWRDKYLDQLKNLSANDFEFKDVKLIVLNKTKFKKISNKIIEVIKFSTFVQNQKFNSNFGEIIYKLSLDADSINFYLSKYHLSWDCIADLTSSMDELSVEEKEDILFREQSSNISELDKILVNLEPALHFWFDSDNLGYKKGKNIVSLNLLDACYNFYNHLPIEKNSHVFMEIAINRTLIARYLDSKVSNELILKQVNSTPEENEFIQIFKNKVVYS
jgi:hypothetical protein